MWKQVSYKLDPSSNPDEDESLENRLKRWWGNERVRTHEALSTLFVFTIWETRNRAVFKTTWTPLEITVNVLMQNLNQLQALPNPKPTRNIKALEID